ncbi:hypothetical protein WAI453_005561 [Rhynchosporium graminicola]
MDPLSGQECVMTRGFPATNLLQLVHDKHRLLPQSRVRTLSRRHLIFELSVRQIEVYEDFSRELGIIVVVLPSKRIRLQ